MGPSRHPDDPFPSRESRFNNDASSPTEMPPPTPSTTTNTPAPSPAEETELGDADAADALVEDGRSPERVAGDNEERRAAEEPADKPDDKASARPWFALPPPRIAKSMPRSERHSHPDRRYDWHALSARSDIDAHFLAYWKARNLNCV